jgi:uncharacterized membrane protein
LEKGSIMAIGLQEMHPALVHFPVALLPLAVGADAVGSLTDNESAFSFGQKAICIAAVGAIGSAVTGLIAGEEVNVEGASQDMLMTHRNLNFVATLVATGMALWRLKHRKPNPTYLAIGAAGVGVLAYTAYLGGSLVYHVGVGVEPARGVYRTDAPKLESGQVASFINTAGTDLVHGVEHMVEEVAKGQIVPTIMTWLRKQPDVAEQSAAQSPA